MKTVKPADGHPADFLGGLGLIDLDGLSKMSADNLRGRSFASFLTSVLAGNRWRLRIGTSTRALALRPESVDTVGALTINLVDFRAQPGDCVRFCHSLQRVALVGTGVEAFALAPRNSARWQRISADTARAIYGASHTHTGDGSMLIAAELARNTAAQQNTIAATDRVAKEISVLTSQIRVFFGDLTKAEVLAAAAGNIPDEN